MSSSKKSKNTAPIQTKMDTKATLQMQAEDSPLQLSTNMEAPIQFEGGGSVQTAAASGLSGSSQQIPHLGKIQHSFGNHDVSNVQAYVGGAAKTANESMGSVAYATGNNVAFKAEPSLHTAAHEAAHVVQQKGGVQLAGGVGRAGDTYEQHADKVADTVVSGGNASGLLSQFSGRTEENNVQQKTDDVQHLVVAGTVITWAMVKTAIGLASAAAGIVGTAITIGQLAAGPAVTSNSGVQGVGGGAVADPQNSISAIGGQAGEIMAKTTASVMAYKRCIDRLKSAGGRNDASGTGITFQREGHEDDAQVDEAALTRELNQAVSAVAFGNLVSLAKGKFFNCIRTNVGPVNKDSTFSWGQNGSTGSSQSCPYNDEAYGWVKLEIEGGKINLSDLESQLGSDSQKSGLNTADYGVTGDEFYTYCNANRVKDDSSEWGRICYVKAASMSGRGYDDDNYFDNDECLVTIGGFRMGQDASTETGLSMESQAVFSWNAGSTSMEWKDDDIAAETFGTFIMPPNYNPSVSAPNDMD